MKLLTYCAGRLDSLCRQAALILQVNILQPRNHIKPGVTVQDQCTQQKHDTYRRFGKYIALLTLS